MRKAIKNKFFDESTIDDRVTTLDSCYGVAKETSKIGVAEESIALAQDIAKNHSKQLLNSQISLSSSNDLKKIVVKNICTM